MPTAEEEKALDERIKASAIAEVKAASDVTVTETTEAITEPKGAGKFTRPTVIEYKSKALGKKVRQTIVYMNPPDSNGWGAIREMREEVL